MHPIFADLVQKLEALAVHVEGTLPSDDPIAIAHGTWNMPALGRADFAREARSIAKLIQEQGGDEIPKSEQAVLGDFGRRIEHIRVNTTGQLWSGNGGVAASAFMLTLETLRRTLVPSLRPDAASDVASRLRKLTTQLRGMESRFKSLDPRTASLAEMVERIEAAYGAADQLPADLELLSESRQKIESLLGDAAKDQSRCALLREDAEKSDETLKSTIESAIAVLKRCEQAYSASTSVGLAAAFNERSDSLSKSMWIWVGGLIFSLAAGAYFGTKQLHSLTEQFSTPGLPVSVILLNLLLSVLSVAAPVWFAWLATKQIGQRFRLSEDYAFKASISRAYEGYRQEAHRIDKDLESRLLASALSRLDELPLRLVESDSHGSPWHELMSSDAVKTAMRSVPEFAGQVRSMAEKSIAALSSIKGKVSENVDPQD